MPAEVHLPLLDRVRIASPCPAKWEDMTGDDVERHCAQCNRSVFDVSTMSREAAESLLRTKVNDPSTRLCIAYFRRADGTVILKDCPVGIRAARDRIARATRRIAAAVGLLAIAGYSTAALRAEPWRIWGWSIKLRDVQPFKVVAAWIHPPALTAAPPGAQRFLGRVADDFVVPPPELIDRHIPIGPRPKS